MVVKKLLKQRYENAKQKFFADESICKENKVVYKKFFDYQEVKLKRINSLSQLDDGTYRTLYGYLQRFKNVNTWFKNKPLTTITKHDIERVYNDLEDGIILNDFGKPFTKEGRLTYYSKVFKSELFKITGKIELARDLIKYTKSDDKEVRFVVEEDFKKIVNNTYKNINKLLLWLAWDIGENINALLQLKKNDFLKQKNPNTKEDEYRVNLRREILKRSRKTRSEITNYSETVELLDQTLSDMQDDEFIFKIDYASAKKLIDRAVARAKVKCQPKGDKPTWKDLRNGMACHLLKTGYTTDEVNARLGHKPSSDEIDKYINFLAIDRHTPKKKVHQFEMEKLNDELNDIKKREKLQTMRNETLQEQVKEQEERMKNMEKEMEKKMIKIAKDMISTGRFDNR